MGGDITVTSEQGRGSTFTVTLPQTVREVPAGLNPRPATPEAPSRVFPNAARILVIDDNQDAREMVQRSLTREGFRVELAAEGRTGLEMAKRLQPDAITLDVMMPGMDGWAVLTALKADPATAEIPVVMITMMDDRSIGFTLGASDFFTKPIDWPRLTAVLHKHRKRAGGQDVLVVEDDPDTRDILRRSLEKEGWRVVGAGNGREGLARLANGIPSLILLDLMMPEMDGFEFMIELRRRPDCKAVPVVVITAKELTEVERQRLHGQAARILQKSSAGREQLIAELRSVLTHDGASGI
jgi:CheY-like chemotaxis protein